MTTENLILLGSMVYFVTTAWVFGGLPPLYRHANFLERLKRSTITAEERALLKKMWPSYALLIVAMICFLLSSPLESTLPTYIGSACLIVSGLRLRSILKNEKALPTPWISSISCRWPSAGLFISRFPMLPYDFWTIGCAAIVMRLLHPLS